MCIREENIEVSSTSSDEYGLVLHGPFLQILQAILAEVPVCREVALQLFARTTDTLTALDLARELGLYDGMTSSRLSNLPPS